MKNTKQPNPRRQNGLFRGALLINLIGKYAAVLTALLLLLTANAAAAKRPNIVLIMVDDLGWSDLGCYGGEIQTPNIDTLAENGIRFRQFQNNAKCTVSRASLLTGVYPSQAGFFDGVSFLKNSVTLGEVMRGAGYHTYASGKNHGLDNLYNRGFDHYYGLRDGACNHFNPGLQRDGEPEPGRKGYPRVWCDDSLMFDTRDPDYQHYFPADFYSTDAFTDKAIEYIDEWTAQATGRPFFLYLAYTAPHDPIMAWPDDIAKYDGVYDVGYETIRAARYQKQQDIGLISAATHPLSPAVHKDWDSLSQSAKDVEASRMEVTAAMIDRIDQQVGALIQTLKDIGAYDNTLILFCSDNGAQYDTINKGDSSATIGSLAWYTSLGADWGNVSDSPFRYWKNSAYNGGSRTPMIAHWPAGIVNPGRFTDKLGHLIDCMPTFVDLTDADYPRTRNNAPVVPMQGESFLDVLYDDTITPRSAPLFLHWGDNRSVIDGDDKLVSQDGGTTWSLYNIATEATEVTDLSAVHPDIYDALLATYNAWDARSYENVLPTVVDDTFFGSVSGSVDVDVLSNDSDSDGSIDAASLQITRQPRYGSVTINDDHTVRYAGSGAAVASDLFAYQVKDDDGEPSNEAFVTIDFAPTQITSITAEAENAVLSGANEVVNASASGGKIVNFNPNNPADFVEWTVSVAAAGDYDLSIAYALGSAARVLDLSVNGSVIQDDLSFPTTGGWSNFLELQVTDIALLAGENTIRFTTNTSTDGPSLDYFTLSQTILTGTDSDGDELPDWFEDLVPGLDRINPADAALDLDGDGESNLLEFKAKTDLANPDSKTGLRLNPIAAGEFRLEWNAVPGAGYEIYKSATLSAWTLNAEQTPQTLIGKHWIQASADQAFYRLEL